MIRNMLLLLLPSNLKDRPRRVEIGDLTIRYVLSKRSDDGPWPASDVQNVVGWPDEVGEVLT